MIISDQDSNVATVDALGRLNIAGGALSEAAAVSLLRGDCYAWNAVSANIDTTDVIILLQNLDPNKELCIESIYLWQNVPSKAHIHFPAHGDWAGGADEVLITGVNMNRSSTKTAIAICYSDAAGATLAAATTMKTLQGNINTADETAFDLILNGTVVLAYQDTISVDNVTEPGGFEATIIGYYK